MVVGVVVVVLELIATIVGLVVSNKKPKPHTDTRAKVVSVAVDDCNAPTTDRDTVQASGDERSQRQDTTLANMASVIEESGDDCISRQR
jgi:hypothetical protein